MISANLDYKISSIAKQINKEADGKAGAQRIFIFSYAQWFDEMIEDFDGYVIGYKRRKEFINLNEVEKACHEL